MKLLSALLPLTLISLFSPVTVEAAVSVPYSRTFTNSASIEDFTSNGTWAIQNDRYRNTLGNSAASSSTLQVTSGLENGFRLSTTYTVVSRSGSTSSTYVGLTALSVGSDALTSSAASPFILADVSSNGELRIVLANSNNPPSITTATLPSAIATNSVYTLTLTGLYVTGGLNLSLSLTNNGVTTTTPTAFIATANIPNGQYFGLRNRSAGGSTTITVDYHDISLTAIPEPGAGVLLAGSALAVAARRRRS